MPAQDQAAIVYGTSVTMGSLTTTGGNETIKVPSPSSIAVPLLQTNFISALWPVAEVWRPVGILYLITTGITVNAAIVTLRKNGVSAATGGTASLPVAAALASEYYFAPFSAYTFAAADAANDKWSVLVTTTSTAGVVNPTFLVYATVRKLNINEGVTL